MYSYGSEPKCVRTQNPETEVTEQYDAHLHLGPKKGLQNHFCSDAQKMKASVLRYVEAQGRSDVECRVGLRGRELKQTN
jgi:hypothetical protein